MSKPVLVFRADGGNKMGTGHLMRSASLAKVLSASFECRLVTRCDVPQLIRQVSSAFSVVNQLAEGEDKAERILKLTDSNRLVVLDGYRFDGTYQQALKDRCCQVAVIDDLVTQPLAAGLAVNHCGGLSPLHYSATPHTVFALGTAYLLLNELFNIAPSERRNSVTDNDCFVCLGGADPGNVTLEVVKDLVVRKRFENIHVVVGAAYLHYAELTAFTQAFGWVRVHQSISLDDVKALMQKCSFAVCSPSTIAFEYLSIGGILWLKSIADNQKYVSRFLVGEGLAFDYGDLASSSEGKFTVAFGQQRNYFDGQAAVRLNKLFAGWYASTQLQTRKAHADDVLTCFNWVNDPTVRAQSYSSAPILLENHTAWFTKKLSASNSYYYILTKEDKPVAQIRFDVDNSAATISYLTDPSFRSQGMGPWILSKGIAALLSDTQPAKIVGHVKKDNIASLRSFEKLAFVKTESSEHEDSFTYTMTLHGNQN